VIYSSNTYDTLDGIEDDVSGHGGGLATATTVTTDRATATTVTTDRATASKAPSSVTGMTTGGGVGKRAGEPTGGGGEEEEKQRI
jgi:hypothetical protein